MSERWRVDTGSDSDGRRRFRVRDVEDPYGPPVAEFATEEEAREHVEKLAGGPFDWDEQEAWQDPDDDEDDEDERSSWV